jgi:alanine racemase
VTEDEYVEMLLERSVAGIIFVSGLHADTSADPARYRRLVAQRLPIVLVNGYVEGIEAPFISPDEAVAAELAVAHLASLGHQRIGLISGPHRFLPVQRKLAGWRRAMTTLLSTPPEELDQLVSLSLWFSVEAGVAAAARLLDRRVTGLVCGSDLMALGAIRAARQRGLSVPRDVSVVGYDDSPLIAFTDPPLTTVRQPVQQMASAAVSALLDEIGGRGAPHSEYVFAPELVVRGSTAAAPPADRHAAPAEPRLVGAG